MTYLPLHSGQCDPNKIKQLSFQIVILKYLIKFQLVMIMTKYMMTLTLKKLPVAAAKFWLWVSLTAVESDRGRRAAGSYF